MNKKIFLIFVFLFLISLTGCKDITIEFIDNDGSLIETRVVKNLDNLKMPTVTKDGYTFDEWKVNKDKGKMIYQATYKANMYKINFNLEESELAPIDIAYDGYCDVLPNLPSKDGNAFIGWEYKGELINLPFSFKYTENITLDPIWSIKVNFVDYNGSLIKSTVVTELDEAICDAPVRNGYIFVSWEKIELSNTIEYRAKYTPNSYKIFFDTDGGSNKSHILVEYNSDVRSFLEPVKENYNFLGWLYNDNLISFPFKYTYTDDIVLKATWKIKDKTIVEYVDYNDELIASFEVYNPEDTSPVEPTRNGYSFVKWEKSIIENKVQFKAVYKPNKYQIIFEADGGTPFSNISVFYEDTILKLPTPIKENYDFVGWLYNDNLITYPFILNVANDITLKALWSLREKIVVEFVDYDSSLIKEMETYYIENATCDEPVRKGYTFLDWEKTTLPGKVIFKANYKVNFYRITFVSNSSYGIDTVSANYGQTITGLPNPVKENYIFMGWFYNNKPVELPFVFDIGTDIIIYAKWEKSIFDSITFEEYNQFYSKVNTWFNNANQIHIDNDLRNKITIDFPTVGKIDVIDNQKVYTKFDRLNGYLESKYSATGINSFYNIYRRDGNLIYFDELILNQDKYILYSNIYNDDLDVFDIKLDFGDNLNNTNSYRKINDNHYLAYTTLGELNSYGMDLDLDELSKELKLKREILEQIGVEIETLFIEASNQFAISVEVKEFGFKIDNIKYSLDIQIKSIYKNYNEEIIPFDYSGDNVLLPIAKSFDEITTITDITEPIISYELLGPHFYKVYLEAGNYSFTSSNVISNDIILYDLNKKIYNLGPLWNIGFTQKKQIIIKESNYYYLKVNNGSASTYTINITKLNYDTISNYDNPILFEKNNIVNIEGEYDYQYYYIDSLVNGILIIDKIENDFLVLYMKNDKEFRTAAINNNKYIIPIKIGYNRFIISADKKSTIKFNTEIINDNLDTTSNINNMPTINNEFSENYYLVGYSCKNDFLKFEITQAGYYKLEFQHYIFRPDPNVEFFYNSNGESITKQNRVYLSSGIHYALISNDIYGCAIVKVRVVPTT